LNVHLEFLLHRSSAPQRRVAHGVPGKANINLTVVAVETAKYERTTCHASCKSSEHVVLRTVGEWSIISFVRLVCRARFVGCVGRCFALRLVAPDTHLYILSRARLAALLEIPSRKYREWVFQLAIAPACSTANLGEPHNALNTCPRRSTFSSRNNKQT
jgi:hypothetical protein